jgi:hypothetical protein
VGRRTAQVRLRVIEHTDKKTLVPHVHRYTDTEATVYTDEWRAYEQVAREHRTIKHSIKEWARDDDGNGIREVHVNTIEGLVPLTNAVMRRIAEVKQLPAALGTTTLPSAHSFPLL